MKHKYNTINYYLGNEIRKMREGRGYSQNEFAEICGISRAYYGRIERGEYNVTVDMCQKSQMVLVVIFLSCLRKFRCNYLRHYVKRLRVLSAFFISY